LTTFAIICHTDKKAGGIPMASMNISLPDQMKAYVEKIAAESGEYTNTSDYIRDLVRHDQDRREKIMNMQDIVDEGRQSGLSSRNAEKIRSDIKKQYATEIE